MVTVGPDLTIRQKDPDNSVVGDLGVTAKEWNCGYEFGLPRKRKLPDYYNEEKHFL